MLVKSLTTIETPNKSNFLKLEVFDFRFQKLKTNLIKK